MKSKNEIVNEIEAYLKQGNVCDYIFKKYKAQYYTALSRLLDNKDIESNPNLNSYFYFECHPSYLNFLGDRIVLNLSNSILGSLYESLYVSDFDYKGFICRTDDDSIKVECNFSAVICIFSTRDSDSRSDPNVWIIKPEKVDVLDQDAFEVLNRGEKEKRIREIIKKYKIEV